MLSLLSFTKRSASVIHAPLPVRYMLQAAFGMKAATWRYTMDANRLHSFRPRVRMPLPSLFVNIQNLYHLHILPLISQYLKTV